MMLTCTYSIHIHMYSRYCSMTLSLTEKYGLRFASRNSGEVSLILVFHKMDPDLVCIYLKCYENIELDTDSEMSKRPVVCEGNSSTVHAAKQ